MTTGTTGTSWMAREIAETPAAVERLLRDGAPAIAHAAEAIALFRPRWVSLVGRGTSDHVATYARYLVETQLGLPAGLAAASVTTVYGASVRWDGGLLLAISQSGRSPDLVSVVEAARAGGALTVVVTNAVDSPLAAAGELVVSCHAGPERAVCATKTYTTGLVAVAAIVAELAALTGSPAAATLRAGLARLPDTQRATLEAAGSWIVSSGIVDAFAATERAIVTSRGYDLATALEIAIKLQEAAGIFAGGSSAADLEHGPVALATADVPVLAIRPDGPMGLRLDHPLERVRAAGARPWIVGGRAVAAADGRSLSLPLDVPPTLAPAALILPGQLLTEAVARARGRDPDLPRGLTKVTLTH